MRVVVPTPMEECPAALALGAEGLEHEIAICSDRYDYGKLMARLWLEETGFIIVEWDVAPWPGALQALWDCPRIHCHYLYPQGGMIGEFAGTLGCVKFAASLTRNHPDIPGRHRWHETSWEGLDGSVCLPVRHRADGVHQHDPPVAHVRRRPPRYLIDLRLEGLTMTHVVCTQYADGEVSFQNEVAASPYDSTVQDILERKALSHGSRGWQIVWTSNGFDATKVYPGLTPFEKRREFRIV